MQSTIHAFDTFHCMRRYNTSMAVHCQAMECCCWPMESCLLLGVGPRTHRAFHAALTVVITARCDAHILPRSIFLCSDVAIPSSHCIVFYVIVRFGSHDYGGACCICALGAVCYLLCVSSIAFIALVSANQYCMMQCLPSSVVGDGSCHSTPFYSRSHCHLLASSAGIFDSIRFNPAHTMRTPDDHSSIPLDLSHYVMRQTSNTNLIATHK